MNSHQQRHAKFEQWLYPMAFPLPAHRFIIRTYEFEDKRGYNRKGVDIIGIDWNDYVMYPQAFPKEFIQYLTDTVTGIMDEEGFTQYVIPSGKLALLYAAYKASIERIAMIDAVLIDLETNPV